MHIFYALDKVEVVDTSHLFDSIDQYFQTSDTLTYDHLIGLGSDGCNVMMGERNSVMSRLRSKQPELPFTVIVILQHLLQTILVQ